MFSALEEAKVGAPSAVCGRHTVVALVPMSGPGEEAADKEGGRREVGAHALLPAREHPGEAKDRKRISPCASLPWLSKR